MKYTVATVTLSLATSLFFSPASQTPATLVGHWTTPDHSIVKVYACGTNTVCARLLQTPDHAAIDDKNPNASLRRRSLCGIELGKDFVVDDAMHAKSGKLYDPDSGKTYSAELTLDGDALKVRGYVGVSMFGRTEVWHRNLDSVPACKL